MTAASQSAFLCAAVNMLLVWPKSPALKPAWASMSGIHMGRE